MSHSREWQKSAHFLLTNKRKDCIAVRLDTSVKVHVRVVVALLLQLRAQIRLQLADRQRLDRREGSDGQRHGSPQTGGAHHYASHARTSPTQLRDDVAPLAGGHAVDLLQPVDDERRQQQHYASHAPHARTRSGQDHTCQSRQVHRLRARLLAHAQRVAVLVRHRDARARLLEPHQVHVRSARARHGEPRDALLLTELQRTHLAQKTTASHLRHQLVARQRHTHRHHRRRAVGLQDVHVVGFRRGIAVAVVEHRVVRLVDPLPQNDIERLRLTPCRQSHGGRRQKHTDLDGDVGGNEAGHSADRVDDLLRLGVLHGLDDVTSVPQLRVRVLVLASLPGLDLGHRLVVRLLAENDLSDRDSPSCIHYLKSQRIMLYFTRPQ